MSQHRLPGEATQRVRPPVVPGGLRVPPPLSDIPSLPLEVDRDPIMIIRNVIAIIRDLLLIILLIVIFIVGHRIITAVSDVRQQIGTFEPATLPVDKCGGGVC